MTMQRYNENRQLAIYSVVFCKKGGLFLTKINRCVCEHTHSVPVNISFSTRFVSSTNPAIESCSGRWVIIGRA